MIVITTDNLGRPEFVYPRKRFSTKDALVSEINKSIKNENKKKITIQNTKDNLEMELNA